MRVLGGAPATWWEQVRLARRRLDRRLVFAPAYSAPTRRACRLLTVPMSRPGAPSGSARANARRALTTNGRTASAHRPYRFGVFARRDHAIPRRAAERIRVVRNGVDRRLDRPRGWSRRWCCCRGCGSSRALRRSLQPTAPAAVIAAFASLPPRCPTRGSNRRRNRTHPARTLLPGAADESREPHLIRSYVSDEELAALYSDARVFVFLSEYEGFGLTPLEALSCGVPLVVLDTPVAREIYQGAAVRVQPDDIEGTAAAIRSLIEEGPVRREVLAEAPRVLASYTWTKAAHETLAALVEAAGGA